MKTIKYINLVLIIMFCTKPGFSQIDEAKTSNFKNLTELETKIADYYTVKEFEKDNISIKSEHRLGHLLVVKFSFKSKEACTTLITVQNFMCTTLFREGPKMAMSKAIGVKKIAAGKTLEEKWFDSESEQLILELEMDETIEIYAVFEVPKKDVEEFEFYCLKTLTDKINM